LRVRKGVAQDASFIEADPGPSNKPRGDDVLTRRSRDGDWVKREKGSLFGFKLHVKTDLDLGLVRAVEATPASVHDSRVDLSESGEAADDDDRRRLLHRCVDPLRGRRHRQVPQRQGLRFVDGSGALGSPVWGEDSDRESLRSREQEAEVGAG